MEFLQEKLKRTQKDLKGDLKPILNALILFLNDFMGLRRVIGLNKFKIA